MRQDLSPPERRVIELVLAAAIGALVILCIFLWRDYKQARSAPVVVRWRSALSALRARGSVSASDVPLIEPWMTFGYVNHIFNLPPDYLKSALAITDAHYPHLSIEEAGEHGNESAFVSSVEQAVKSYLASTTPQ